MSFRLIPHAWDAQIPAIPKLILLKLVDCANDDGSCIRPAVATIAQDCGCGERTVKEHLRRFRAQGLLRVVREGRGVRPREYELDLGQLVALASPKGELAASEEVQQTPPTGAADAPPRVQQMHPTGAANAPDPSGTPEKNKNRACAREDPGQDEDTVASWEAILETVRPWIDEQRPDLDPDAEFEAWRDHMLGYGFEVPDDLNRAAALFRGWARRSKPGKNQPAAATEASADEPDLAFTGEPGEDERALWAEIAKDFCHSAENGAALWANWFAPLPLRRITGSIVLIDGDERDFRPDWIVRHAQLIDTIERAASRQAGREMQIKFLRQSEEATV